MDEGESEAEIVDRAGAQEQAQGHMHGELFHEHADDFAFGFRCTLCRRAIGKPLTKAELGIGADEDIQAGKMYRYDKCYCGFGRFVTAERTYIDPEELHRHMAEHMQH